MLKRTVRFLRDYRMYSFLLVLLLSVSVIISYYLLGFGYSWAMNNGRIEDLKKSFTVSFDGSSRINPEKLFRDIEAAAHTESFGMIGHVKEFSYTDGFSGESLTTGRLNIGAVYQESDKSIRVDTGDAALKKTGQIFFTDYNYGLKAGDNVKIGDKSLTVSGTGYYDSPLYGEVGAYVLPGDFLMYSENTIKVSFKMSEVPSNSEIDNIMQILEGLEGITDITVPDTDPKEEIDISALFVAVAILLFSFININAGLTFFLKLRKKEYSVYTLCGAMPAYFCWDTMLFTMTLTLVPYVIGSFLYAILYLCLGGHINNMALNPYLMFVVLTIMLVFALSSSFILMKNRKKI